MGLALGVDLGGTKTEIIALDDRGVELLRRRRPTPRGDYAATIEVIAQMVESAEAELGARGTVGIGHPGATSPSSGRLKNANSVWLNDRPFHEDLVGRLGRPLALANDANCLALSEATDGAGAGATTVFAVILGTGVGGGISVARRILVGPNAIAGEWGHNALPRPIADESPGPACYCGRHGCIETWLSGPGLAADHRRVTGQELKGEAIAVAAERGDEAATASLDRYAERLARALAAVINILDPDAIVLGGGLSRVERLYTEVPRHLPASVFSDRVLTRILPAVHGDSSGVRGAAWLGAALER